MCPRLIYRLGLVKYRARASIITVKFFSDKGPIQPSTKTELANDPTSSVD